MSKEIAITITPIWAIIEHVRKRIKNDLRGVVDEQKADAAMICSSELCENAIKYGDSVEHMQFIQFLLKTDPTSIVITVSNGVTNPQDKENLLLIIDKIHKARAPEQLYINRLKELIENARPQKSQLGLYRITYETGVSLEVTEKEDYVVVKATLNLS